MFRAVEQVYLPRIATRRFPGDDDDNSRRGNGIDDGSDGFGRVAPTPTDSVERG